MEIEKNFIINLQHNQPKCFYDIMNVISLPFNFNIFIIVIFILYYNNLITLKHIILLITSQIVLGTIKYVVKRKRPFNATHLIKNKEIMMFDKYSFPSGHTLNAFLLYYILIHQKLISNLYIIFPTIVGFSRVALGVHYPTDIIGGIILSKLLSITLK
jgi:membrane-associated phospholipid phosphatase